MEITQQKKSHIDKLAWLRQLSGGEDPVEVKLKELRAQVAELEELLANTTPEERQAARDEKEAATRLWSEQIFGAMRARDLERQEAQKARRRESDRARREAAKAAKTVA